MPTVPSLQTEYDEQKFVIETHLKLMLDFLYKVKCFTR